MKTRILTALLLLSIFSCQTLKAQSRTVLPDGTVIINTTEIVQDIRGHHDATPVEITIREDTIRDVKALPSRESPRFFNRAAELLRSFIGLTVDEALAKETDTVSGATMSSRSLIGNVQAGLKHHKDLQEEEGASKITIIGIRHEDLIRK